MTDLRPGTALAARARAARYAALGAACAEAGILHLLVAHHAADQAETVLMRERAGSGPDGLAGMAALVALPALRLLRPLLGVPPGSLRALLRTTGLGWVEDPSNANLAATRPRLRALLGDPAGTGPVTRDLVARADRHAAARAVREAQVAACLAERVRLYPQGFAVLSPGMLPAPALAALLRTIAGAAFPPSPAAVAALAAAPRPATLGGVRLLPAGRLGPGLLVVREAAAMAGPVAARPGAVWDGRFRLAADTDLAEGTLVGALGAVDAPSLRARSWLPAAVLETLPALRRADALVAVPHLCYASQSLCALPTPVFAPACAAAPAPFVGSHSDMRAG